MLATRWQGCYQYTWQDSIVPEAFCHPAKFSRGLIHRIYRHMLEQGYITEGSTILDPFGGVALGALDAMTYGLRYIGVELEPKFVELGNKNLDLWRQRYGFTGGTIVQGDSRQLRAVLAGAQIQAVVGSPPYVESHANPGNDPQPRPGDVRAYPRTHYHAAYGTTPGQLGAMPPGAVVSSPPWENALAGSETCVAPHDTNGTLKAQYKERPVGASYQDVSQRKRLPDGTWPRQRPEAFYNNLGITAGDTFWSAAAQIMQELALLLPAGAVCAWVVKSYVKNKQVVPFPDQWRVLCEAHGFALVEEIHASLVEDHGTQEGLFGEAQRVTTEKKSFFRRLAEKKGSPRIDHETVLIVRKAGDGGGMCCVSSPPYEGSVNGDHRPYGGIASPEQQGGVFHGSYGTTPGNLGNLPVGRP